MLVFRDVEGGEFPRVLVLTFSEKVTKPTNPNCPNQAVHPAYRKLQVH